MTIQEYQKDCFENYKKEIGLDPNYNYLYGNPINVLVPIETAINKFMIVGAYPSAKFFKVGKILDTPLYDNDSPFSNESYFDGTRVRTIPSGEELNEVILKNIGVERSECWITDLVKVFLFKEGHINRYKKLEKTDLVENRTKYDEFAKLSLRRLEIEIKLANPELIILLGVEVAKNVLSVSDVKSKEYMDGRIITQIIKNTPRKFACLPHPGILMKKSEKNPWPEKFLKIIAPKIKIEVEQIKESLTIV